MICPKCGSEDIVINPNPTSDGLGGYDYEYEQVCLKCNHSFPIDEEENEQRPKAE